MRRTRRSARHGTVMRERIYVSTGDQQSTLKGERSSEPWAAAGSELGQGFQDQIGQALQPAMAELRDRIAASVRRELDQRARDEGRGSRPEGRGEGRGSRPGGRGEEPDDAEAARDDSDAARARSRARPEELSSDEAEQSGDDPSEPSNASDGDASNDSAAPPAMAGPELSRTLQEQIGQALGPAMAEFREQMAATVRRELDETLQREPRRASTTTDRPSAGGQNQAADRDQEQPTDRGRDQEPDRDQEQPTDRGRDRDQERPTDRGRDQEPDRGR